MLLLVRRQQRGDLHRRTAPARILITCAPCRRVIFHPLHLERRQLTPLNSKLHHMSRLDLRLNHRIRLRREQTLQITTIRERLHLSLGVGAVGGGCGQRRRAEGAVNLDKRRGRR